MKKAFVFFMALVLTFGLVACSSDSGDATKGNDKADGKAEDKGKTTIRLVMKDEVDSNPVSKKYFAELEKALKKDENLEVKFELVEVPEGDYSEKLNLLLYSGDIPDLIYFQGGDLPISQQGLLEDLTPYIKESKHIKNILEPYHEARLANYPYLLWIKPLDQKTPVIRKDLFDKTKSGTKLMENPTVDNYYEFFKELVENSSGDNKNPKYAFTAAGDIAELDYIFDMAFGIDKDWLKKKDGTLEYAKVSEKEKEKLTFYNKLYKEGLIDPQYITKKWDTKEKAFYDGEAAVIVGTAGKVIDIYNGKMKQVNGKDAELVVLPPAKGEGQGYGSTDVTKEARGIAISSQSEHKEIAFKILDYLASPKGQMFDRLGFEGEHYKVVDGEIALDEKYYNEWYSRFWEPKAFDPEKPLKTPLLSEPATESQKLVQKHYSENNNVIIPEELVASKDAIDNLYKEYATDMITGKRPIADFDKFVDEWKQAGGEQITDFVNEK